MSNTIDIQIPFAGFYETVHDKEIDEAFESHYEIGDFGLGSDSVSEEEQRQIYDAIWDADVDWSGIRQEYVKEYCKVFGDKFGLELEFIEMISPREYNFSTDRVFAKVDKNQFNEKIRKPVEEHEDWSEHVKEKFTSVSGFISFFSNDSKSQEWTANVLKEVQYEVMLQFWLDNICEDVGSEGWYMEEIYMLEKMNVWEYKSFNKSLDIVDAYMNDKQKQLKEA